MSRVGHGHPAYGRQRVMRFITWPFGRVVRAQVCPLCGVLVLASASEHHESIHRVGKRG